MKKGAHIFDVNVTEQNVTLLRLVANNPELFYNQDWYYDEEFANIRLETGNHSFGKGTGYPPAVACAWSYLNGNEDVRAFWDMNYVWACEADSKGNAVYVGGAALGAKHGFQIHRHLANPSVLTVGYTLW